MRARGFTLVELLLAVTLLSMLLALAYGGMRAATRATDRGQQVLEESGRLRMAHQFVRKQLNQAIPLAFSQAEGAALEEPISEVFLGAPGHESRPLPPPAPPSSLPAPAPGAPPVELLPAPG